MRGWLDLVLGCFGVFSWRKVKKSSQVSPEGEHPSSVPGEQFVGGASGGKWYLSPLPPLLSGLPIHCIWLLLALSDPIMPT